MPPALQRFPEVLALDVDRQLKVNVETLQSQWFVRGLALKKLLRSQPQVCRQASTVHWEILPVPTLLHVLCSASATANVLAWQSLMLRIPVRRFLATMLIVAETARATVTGVGFASDTTHCCHGHRAHGTGDNDKSSVANRVKASKVHVVDARRVHLLD